MLFHILEQSCSISLFPQTDRSSGQKSERMKNSFKSPAAGSCELSAGEEEPGLSVLLQGLAGCRASAFSNPTGKW